MGTVVFIFTETFASGVRNSGVLLCVVRIESILALKLYSITSGFCALKNSKLVCPQSLLMVRSLKITVSPGFAGLRLS